MRLGRLAHCPVALAAAPSHRFGPTPPPLVLDRSRLAFLPELYGNDRFPDCTAVALANAARGVAVLNGFDLIVEPASVPAFYAACVGNPSDLVATDGVVVLDALQRQAHDGFDIGPQRLYGLYGSIDVQDRAALAQAIVRLGVGYWGVTLRERDLELTDLWDVQEGRDDGDVVGGHVVIAWDYAGLDAAGTVRVGTWGDWQRASWGWVSARLQEAYAIVWRQLARANGTFYQGLTVNGLVAEVEGA